MNGFDNELRAALGRQEPPAGFTARVLQQVDGEQIRPVRSRPQVMAWAVAAALLVAVAGGAQYRNVQRMRDERARGEAAAEQVMQALRIAGSKLLVVQATVKEFGS